MLRLTDDPRAPGASLLTAQKAFLGNRSGGVSGCRGRPGRPWVGCSCRWDCNRSPQGRSQNALQLPGGTGCGAQSLRLAPWRCLGDGPQGGSPGQAVLILLLCFSPGPWNLQSGQSVPGTHDQHPVGADAHQSVHALGHR